MLKRGFQVRNAGPLATADRAVETARRAEALRYASIVVTDHVVIPRHMESRYPNDAAGRLIVPHDADYSELLAMLGFLAGATSRIRPGPSVLVLPYRNPVLTAKMLATMDVPSGGRLFVGIGAGWLAEEFAGSRAASTGSAGCAAARSPSRSRTRRSSLRPIVALGPTHAMFDCRTGSFEELLETMERPAGDVSPGFGA